jgi:hypothetical protein
MEDVNPVTRFFKLIIALRLDIVESAHNPAARKPHGLNLDNLYTQTAERLAKWIDINNLLAISDNRRTMINQPRAEELFPLERAEILRALRLSEAPVTFPVHSQTSKMWLKAYSESEKPLTFGRLRDIRTAAMKKRQSTPNVFNVWRPLDFFASVGLPSFYCGSDGLYQAEQEPGETKIASVEVLDEIETREVLLAICESGVQQARMVCPRAVGRLKVHKCPAQTARCSGIVVPDELPERDCAARRVFQTFFGGQASNANFD